MLDPVSGGDIHRAFKARLGSELFFIKLNQPEAGPMFAAEHRSLEALAAHTGLRVPRPVCHGADGELAWLVMEYIELTDRGDHSTLGAGLARMHQVKGSAHGWAESNFIGATPQPNERSGDWVEFWQRQRLGHQVELATRDGDPGGLRARARQLADCLPVLFSNHSPAPALLHGDLWRGNFAFDGEGSPVLFDPACYYGDRETDLAMTELFGGFDPEFYDAYNSVWPLDKAYPRRKPLYQLYHVLNHLNLFGSGWLGQTTRLMDQIIAQCEDMNKFD